MISINLDGIGGNLSTNGFGNSGGGKIELTIETSLQILQTYLQYYSDIIGNDLGIYNVAKGVRSGKAIWGSFSKNDFITKPRPTGCTRDPIRGTLLTTTDATLTDRHIFLEICNDDLVNTAWRNLFGQGKDINDIMSTPFGQYAMLQFIRSTVAGIGNDFTLNSFVGNDPAITEALNVNTKLTEEMKARIKDTLTKFNSGWFTTADALGLTGDFPNLSIQINNDDVNGTKFIGDAMGLIRALDEQAHPDFDDALLSLETENKLPVVLVTKGIFNRLKDQLHTSGALASTFQYTLNGRYTSELSPNLVGMVSPSCLVYDNKIIKVKNEIDSFNRRIGLGQQRAMMVLPGVLGTAINVNELSQYDGLGMVIEKATSPKDAGKYFISCDYAATNMLIDPRFVVSAKSNPIVGL